MNVGNIVIGLLVLAFILYRQLQPRAIREDNPYRIMGILAIIGLLELVSFGNKHDVPGKAWLLLALSIAIGAGFGALRGLFVHVWRKDGVLTRQGNASTIVLWIVAIAIHFGADAVIGHEAPNAKGLADTGVLLYLAFALAAQQAVVIERGRKMLDEGVVRGQVF